MGRSLKLIAVLVFASLALTACGKRGALEPPGVADSDAPKEHQGDTKKQNEEHRSFILDGLLR